MKRRYFLKLCSAAGASLLSGCAGGSFSPIDLSLDEDLEDKITAPTETEITNRKLIRPCGITSVTLGEKALPRQREIPSNNPPIKKTVFFDAPKYKLPEWGGEELFLHFSRTPRLYDATDDTMLYEFTNEELNSDSYMFFTAVIFGHGELPGNAIPMGLTVSMVSLEDSLLLTTNSGLNKRIVRIFTDKKGNREREVYLEHDDLVLANDMIVGKDGKLYITQSAIYHGFYKGPPPFPYDPNDPDEGKLLRPARVISIDADKNLNVEFELPSHLHSGSNGIPPIAKNRLYPGSQSYWVGDRIKIVEEDDNLFVSDLIEQKVYAISKSSREVSLFQDLSGYPPMCLLSNQGSLYVISTPILRKDETIFRNPKLLRINGETIEEVYDFDLGDFSFQGLLNYVFPRDIKIGERNLKYPQFYNISATLEDDLSDGSLESHLTYTDSHRQQVRRVVFPGGISNHPIN